MGHRLLRSKTETDQAAFPGQDHMYPFGVIGVVYYSVFSVKEMYPRVDISYDQSYCTVDRSLNTLLKCKWGVHSTEYTEYKN